MRSNRNDMSIKTEVKQIIKEVIDRNNPGYYHRKKDALICKWFYEFMAEDEKSFEEIYIGWEADCVLKSGGHNFSIPTCEEIEKEINDQGCDWMRFNNYFQDNLKIK